MRRARNALQVGLLLLSGLMPGCPPAPCTAVELAVDNGTPHQTALSGPSSLTVGAPRQTYTVTITTAGDVPAPSSQPVFVLLKEDPHGGNVTGGLFSWAKVTFPAGAISTVVQFQLFCPGNSVVGGDEVTFPCNAAAGGACDASSTTSSGPCSCVGIDGTTPNDPDSRLGGRDVIGQPLSAQIHAELATVDSCGVHPFGNSQSISVNCISP
jgi:hypothetical protein